MKKLSELKDDNFIAIAKLIDNNFIGNSKIVVHPMKMGVVRVTGYTEGKQCINCDVKIDIYMNKLKGVYTHNENPESEDAYRTVYPSTLKRVVDYLTENNYEL